MDNDKDIKVFYIGYQPYFISMAHILKRELGWEPVYWSVTRVTNDMVKQEFPNAIRHDHYDAVKGIPPDKFLDLQLEPVSISLMDKMSRNESITLTMLERNDSHARSFSYKERLALYRYFLKYWQTVLKRMAPEYVILEEEPHQGTDFVLYQLCKEFGVKTILFVRTKFQKTMFPVERFEDGSLTIKEQYSKALKEYGTDNPELDEELEEYFRGILGDYNNAVNFHLYDQENEVNDILKKQEGISHLLRKMTGIAGNALNLNNLALRWRFIFDKPGSIFLSDQKQKRKPFRDSKLTYIEHIYYKTKALLTKKRLRAYYESIANHSVDLNGRYIFVALHYQPEKSTCPLGGYFDDQLYMLELLSYHLPKGWKLYVKDHMSQFVGSYTRYGEIYRSREFYDVVKSFKNVEIIPLSFDTFSLIDNSEAVASVTATTCWEAVMRGKPAIVFGNAWYRYCEGTFFTQSVDDLVKALDKIKEGYKIAPNKVRIFAKTVKDNSFPGVVGGPMEQKYFGVTVADNARAHADAVKSIIANNGNDASLNEVIIPNYGQEEYTSA